MKCRICKDKTPRLVVMGLNNSQQCILTPNRRRRVKRLRKIYGSSCHYCNRNIYPCEYTLDHKIALANGGKNEMENKVASCYLCNQRKGNKSYFEFKKETSLIIYNPMVKNRIDWRY